MVPNKWMCVLRPQSPTRRVPRLCPKRPDAAGLAARVVTRGRTAAPVVGECSMIALLAVRSSNTRHSKCRAAFNFVKTATQSHALDWQIEFEMNIWKTRSRPPQITGLANGVRGRQAVSRKPLVYGAMQAKLLWQILQLSLARCGYVPANYFRGSN